MPLLELIIISVLQFEGTCGEPTFTYRSTGRDAALPCGSASSSDTSCSVVSWFYNRDRSATTTEAGGGNVEKRLARDARLSLGASCSLVINNIMPGDAGLYTCLQRRDDGQLIETSVHLCVLTISILPPDADPKRDGEVTLKCSLQRSSRLRPCEHDSILWVDETGTALRGEGVGFKVLSQMNCVSYLTVKRQSGHNRRYTCQHVDGENNVKTEAGYTPLFTDSSGWPMSSTSWALRTSGVILVLVISVFVIRYKETRKPTGRDNVQEDEGEVIYENVELSPAATLSSSG